MQTGREPFFSTGQLKERNLTGAWSARADRRCCCADQVMAKGQAHSDVLQAWLTETFHTACQLQRLALCTLLPPGFKGDSEVGAFAVPSISVDRAPGSWVWKNLDQLDGLQKPLMSHDSTSARGPVWRRFPHNKDLCSKKDLNFRSKAKSKPSKSIQSILQVLLYSYKYFNPGDTKENGQ